MRGIAMISAIMKSPATRVIAFVELGKGGLGRPDPSPRKVRLGFRPTHFGNVDLEVPDRAVVELASASLSPSTSDQTIALYRISQACRCVLTGIWHALEARHYTLDATMAPSKIDCLF